MRFSALPLFVFAEEGSILIFQFISDFEIKIMAILDLTEFRTSNRIQAFLIINPPICFVHSIAKSGSRARRRRWSWRGCRICCWQPYELLYLYENDVNYKVAECSGIRIRQGICCFVATPGKSSTRCQLQKTCARTCRMVLDLSAD